MAGMIRGSFRSQRFAAVVSRRSQFKKFVELCGVSKSNSSVDYAMLEYCIREDLKLKRPRMMAVLDPVKLIIDNYPEGSDGRCSMWQMNLENPELGMKKVPFGRELYIDREDFMENPPKKYFRLFPGNEVRLMGAYFVKCVGFQEGCRRKCDGDPLHLRSGDKVRKRLYGTEGERNDPLGSGKDCGSGRGTSV